MNLKLIKTLVFLLVCQFTYAQNSGDFVSVSTGSWSNAASWGIWDGVKAQPTQMLPKGGNNVYIGKGHTIKLEKDESVANLTVAKGGQLVSDGLGIKKLFVGAGLGSKTASLITNDGIIGGDAGNNLISIEVQNSTVNSQNGPFPNQSTFTIMGSGKTTVSALVALGMGMKETKTKSLVININMPVELTGEGKHRTLTLFRGNSNSAYEDYTMNINSPVTLIKPDGSFNFGTQTLLPGGKYTYNINSTLDFSASSMSHGFIPLVNAESSFKLYVNKGGVYVMSPKIIMTNSAVTAAGSIAMVVNDGGKVDASRVKNLPSNAFTVNGTGSLVK